ncbi:MAG: PucR family transcriptional regulator [Sulfobacillus acidophilus]|uniref:PucR family transcriptional regulator n=1 Tax=Sulfobacillus acidophilus TaxID=53633 RepID=A0A2T2WF07_9FIRM|nr:MAG: PucR family transcriptional regulator [Sulfobacillus acidophilus]
MITVRDVLSRPVFRTAVIAGGLDGLDRPVHWVHVGEIPNLGQYLKGYELVLTTGVGLTSLTARYRFIRGLITAGASGLVIELGQYLPQVPPDLIDLANVEHFPIIAFHNPVRFLELSQDINALLISQHHRILDDLEALSQGIRQAMLNTEGAVRLVQLLFESIARPVLYRPRDPADTPIVFGEWVEQPALPSDVALHPVQESTPHHRIRQSVMVFGEPIGDVFVANPGNPIDERVYLALDSTVAALAQDFIRVESLDRLRRREEGALLEHLLFEENPEPYLCQRFRGRYRLTPGYAYRVLAIATTTPLAPQMVRQLLPANMICAVYNQTDQTIFVVIGSAHAIEELPHLLPSPGMTPGEQPLLGISSQYNDPADMHQALSEANDAAAIARYCGRGQVSYDKMGIWRWILFTPHHHLQRLLIEPELGPLLQRRDRARLLETLDALLTHLDSKQAASHMLGIHRQTLYARIRVLEETLGPDFMAPARRTAIEAALMAHRYLTGTPAPKRQG